MDVIEIIGGGQHNDAQCGERRLAPDPSEDIKAVRVEVNKAFRESVGIDTPVKAGSKPAEESTKKNEDPSNSQTGA